MCYPCPRTTVTYVPGLYTTKERKQGEVLQVRALRASGAEGVVGPTDIHLTSCRDDPATPSRRMRSILQRNEVPHHSVSLRETALPFRESRCHPGMVNACESQNREMRHLKNGGRPHQYPSPGLMLTHETAIDTLGGKRFLGQDLQHVCRSISGSGTPAIG